MKPLKLLDGAELGETLFAFVAQAMASGARTRVELAQFSGLAADVQIDTAAIYLRCTTRRLVDSAGAAGEIWGRLQGLSGHWSIPCEACEVVILIAEDVGEAPGAGWILSTGSDTPPPLVTQAQARIYHPATVDLAIDAKTVVVNQGVLAVARQTDPVGCGTLSGTAPGGGGPVTFTFTPQGGGVPVVGTSVALPGKITGGAAGFKA